MPYAAWLVVATGMKQAREAGLFLDWVPGNKRRHEHEFSSTKQDGVRSGAVAP